MTAAASAAHGEPRTEDENVNTAEPKDYDICTNCNERPAIGVWTGEGGVMAWIHGQYTYWCEQCMLKAQIAYAREAADRLPELEARLAELEPQP